MRSWQFPQQADDQAQRQIRDIVGKHIGRVGDAYATGARVFAVDPIVTNPADGNNAQRRQLLDQRAFNAHMSAGHHGPNCLGMSLKPGSLVVDFKPSIDLESLLKTLLEQGRHGTQLQYFDGHDV